MGKYIDAEKLKAEIKAWRNKQIGFAWDAVNEVLKIVSSIQQEQPEGNLEYWLEHFGMPKENIDNCITQIAQGYGACRYLEGVQHGAEAVNELAQQEHPSLPSNLDEAAKKIAYGVCKQLPNGTEKDSIVYYAILAAKAGAEWMAGQGMDVDAEVCKLTDRAWVTVIDEKQFRNELHNKFNSGDKVVVQIRKK